ncbi:hypothetical protein ACH5RR_018257 [Cinchona calisaya]|uniref:Uncharacterized protein n=1 Tax=Cinchona calisaya TaxID=153742 RepID=A0ABD2ZLD4_9GENT
MPLVCDFYSGNNLNGQCSSEGMPIIHPNLFTIVKMFKEKWMMFMFNFVELRRELETQRRENEMVKRETETLRRDNELFVRNQGPLTKKIGNSIGTSGKTSIRKT